MTNEHLELITAGRHYLIYVDGACRGNPGPGGWGAIIQLRDGATTLRKRELSDAVLPVTTNNRMDMTAAIKAIERLVEKETPALIRSDSQYLVKGMTEWMADWKAYGWRTGKGKGNAVENHDLWTQLDALAQFHQSLHWQWVRGHSGEPMNERCDLLANMIIDRTMRTRTYR